MGLNNIERISYFKKKWPESEEKNHFKKILIVIFLFLFFSLILLFFYLFFFKEGFLKKERTVEIKIETPFEIFVGQDFNLEISILNRENSDLINSELLINFPEDFYYSSSDPICSKILLRGCLFSLSRIKKGIKTDIKIKGKTFALPEEKKSFIANLSFQLENFSSWFKKEVRKEISLSKSFFDLETFGSEELMIGEEGEFRIKVKNMSEEYNKARIILTTFKDFDFTFVNPETNETKENEKVFDLDFEKNEEKNIDFKGFFLEEGEKKIIARLGVLDPKGNFFLQLEKEFLVKIIQPSLVLGIKVNDYFLEEIPQNFGDEIEVRLSYKNIGQETIFEPSIKFKINQKFAIDFEKLKNDFWEWKQTDKNLRENKWQIEEINGEKNIIFKSLKVSEIRAGEEGEIIFPLKIKSYEEIAKLKPINLKINFVAEIEAKVFRRQTIIFKILSNQINLKINSKVKLETEVRYFSEEGLKIGSGPIPPKVGETTSYFIFLRPFNTTNEIKNIKIETRLPEKVIWLNEEKVSIGQLFYDSFSKKIIWQIDSISSYTGGPYSFLEASFKIGLIPNEDDRGKILTLLEKTTLEAEDSFTGTKIYLEVKSLDTNLEFDNWAKGKGVIE